MRSLRRRPRVPDFDVLIYKDDVFQPFSKEYIGNLRRLIRYDAILRITDGSYSEPAKAFKFKLNGRSVRHSADRPGDQRPEDFPGHLRAEGGSAQGQGHEMWVVHVRFLRVRFRPGPELQHFLNSEDRKILKAHRIYLYRDKIRVYPYGAPDDDWLQIDAYRGKIAAGWFFSNDQVVGFVNITQKGNPKLRDKTNREGLIDIGDATSDFIHLIQILLFWVRRKPFAQYLAKQKKGKDVEVVKKEQVKAALDVVAEKLGNNKPAQTALAQAARSSTSRSAVT